MSTARDEILSRIRRALASPPAAREQDYAAIPRQYRISGSLDRQSCLSLFAGMLHDYGAGVYRCAPDAIRDTIADVLAAREKNRIVVAADIPPGWLPAAFEWLSDENLSHSQIDQAGGVLTRCAVAIAATGTIVLAHSAATSRRAVTLLPDYHLCVVFSNQVMETVPEGIRALASPITTPLTTISGASATSDIEMTRVSGVHGPRTLDVILAEPAI